MARSGNAAGYFRAPALRGPVACAAHAGDSLRHGQQSLERDGFVATAADSVVSIVDAGQSGINLRDLRQRCLVDAFQHLIIPGLQRLFGKVRYQRFFCMTTIAIQIQVARPEVGPPCLKGPANGGNIET